MQFTSAAAAEARTAGDLLGIESPSGTSLDGIRQEASGHPANAAMSAGNNGYRENQVCHADHRGGEPQGGAGKVFRASRLDTLNRFKVMGACRKACWTARNGWQLLHGILHPDGETLRL
ncbi:MAG: hypothetical protein ACLU3I_14130 [Acutalibacteraceae bacterium]